MQHQRVGVCECETAQHMELSCTDYSWIKTQYFHGKFDKNQWRNCQDSVTGFNLKPGTSKV